MAINPIHEENYLTKTVVPEMPAIMGALEEASEQYRARGRAQLDLAYGEGARHKLDLFFPDGDDEAPALAVFIHGGYWRARDRKGVSDLARGLNAHGLPVAIPSYDLCPDVTIADIIVQMRKCMAFLWNSFHKPLILIGHSAGGHLTAAMLTTNWAQQGAADIEISGAFPISGVFDVRPLAETSLCSELNLTEETAFEVSPLFQIPTISTRLIACAGAEETKGFREQSQWLVDGWGEHIDDISYQEIEGANHFTILANLQNRDSDMVKQIVALAP